MNCAQCVATVFADTVDVDPDTLRRAATGFGGGFGGCGEVCGVLSGISLIGGFRGQSKKDVYPFVHAQVDKFHQDHGSVLCRDLKGNCMKLIEDAITQLHNSLESQSEKE